MAEEGNAAVVRKALEAFNKADYEAVIEFTHPEIEVVRMGGLGTIVGREEAFGLMLPDAFDAQRMDVEEIRAEGDVVLVRAHFHARGAGSGIELSRESHNVFWMENGLVKKMATYLDPEEAFAAAGFSD